MKKTLLSMAFAFAALATGGLNAAAATDVLTANGLGLQITDGDPGYATFSNKTFESGAIYGGCAMMSESQTTIQLRSDKSNSGIVTTATATEGSLTMITVQWNKGTAAGRSIDIYGSNTPYASAEDLYNSNSQGTLIGSLQKGETELVVEGGYQYFGIRSHSGALYLDEIQVTWGNAVVEERVEVPTFSVAGGLYMEATNVTISCATAGATIHYAINGEAEQAGVAGESVTVSLTEDGSYTITAYATAEGMRDSETAEATYIINTALANAFFIETFDKISGTGGNDGEWKGSIAQGSMENTDMHGWTFMNITDKKQVNNWGAAQCVKLGTGSDAGSATTPALEGIGSYAVMTFKAGSWDGDGTTLHLSISGSGQLSETSFQLTDASWGNYTVYIENATAASKVTFANSGGEQRFFLDEVVIANEAMTQLVDPGFSGVAEGASYWDEATVEIACATEGATINYTVTKDDVADEPVTGAASPVSVKLTEPGRYTVTATASKDGETSEEASISFTIVTFDRLDPNGEIKEGTYMIVAADETGQYYMMKNAVESNNYVQATVFDFEAGVPTTDETCLFFVEKADGGYYIKNFDQTYVSLVESGSRTYLKPAEETPFVWTFSGTKDAVVAAGTEITVPMGFQIYNNNTPEFAAGNDYTKPMFIYVNNETSGVESTMAGGVAVAGIDGAIAVAADEAVAVAVYTAAGQVVVSTEVAAGTTELSVAPGFYIVKAGDVVKKVIVK